MKQDIKYNRNKNEKNLMEIKIAINLRNKFQ